ncbi:MAG: hypothetical protein LBS30_03880, partial [Planctomycetota bacterium]|nr:hypothetical protein [Planctomycetota bacterium]
MIAARLKNIFFTLLVTQIASASIAFVLCGYVVLNHEAASTHEDIVSLFYLITAFFASTVCFLILFYKRMVRFDNARRSVTASGIVSAEKAILCAGAAAAIAAVLLGAPHSLPFLAGVTATTMILVALLHVISCSLLHRLYNHPNNKLKVLVLGMNRRAVEFCTIIGDTEHIGAEILGYLDVRELPEAPVKYLGGIDALENTLRSEVIDMASIFLPVRSFYDVVDHVIETCGFYGVTSYIVGNVFEAANIKRVPTSINDFGNMAFSSTTVDYVGLALKRVFDFLSCMAGLAVLSP